MNDLIINEIDYSAFDLEWAEHGGVVVLKKYLAKVTYVCNISDSVQVAQILGQKVFNGESFANVSPRLLRMATPDECRKVGVKYIEPPMIWRDIESAPKNQLILLLQRTLSYGDCIYSGAYVDGEWLDYTGKVHNSPHLWMPLPQQQKDEQ